MQLRNGTLNLWMGDCGDCGSPVRGAWRGGRDVRWVARMLLLSLGRQSEGIIDGD